MTKSADSSDSNPNTAVPGITLQPVAGDEFRADGADIVIIGGGIAGACTALFLAQGGVKVVLCEKGAIGAEQSGRNWGWVRQMGREPVEIPLAIESLKLWRDLNRVTAAETGFRQTGITYLCERTRDADEKDTWLSQARDLGLPSRWLADGEVARLLPGLTKPIKGALYTETDGRAEPALAAPAIGEAARRAGSRIYTNCAVRGIERQAGRVCSVVTEHGVIACHTVVIAAGAWTRLFAGNLGIDFPQLKILGLAARIGDVDGVSDMPVGGSDFSFRKRLDGGFTVGLRNFNIAPIIPDSFRLLADFLPNFLKHRGEIKPRLGRLFIEEWRMPRRWHPDEISPFERERVADPRPIERLNARGVTNLGRAFPAFAGARIIESWAGLIDVTPDGTPVIGPVESVPGMYVVSGFSGHGFGIGPGAGRLAADLILGRDPCVDPLPFRLERLRKPKTAST